ncbi:retron St85 family effector protein [Rheinheimera tangshanensis]|uniref:UDP-3-O-(3-hydroxymyristoyl)glucosamine N-acyltransferase n=1 Tax=Rheinheimera tangshanensis TaxID=400153 RepID=A0A5C8LUS6_9GAMM|nr:retron St85 family effector protein [Rheinheimera tangshanensis]TXK79469.1 hypothetical protein FU839_14035 [Rheinheimera tangshanensis]GGM50712.1 hypothetical protein GCM10010920_08940 [Rheinheimera tangshanensis]
MQKNLRDNEMAEIAKIVKETIFIPRNQKKVTVFLCGADIKDESTSRSKMAAVFSDYPRYEILYPEDLFDDLLAGQGQHSLLKLENILADSVDAIVLFPESPGSFAELGAFSNNENLARKMIVLSNKKYKSNKSFINYGPNRLIRLSKTGKVINISYDDLDDSVEKHKIYRKVNDYISKIKKTHPVKADVTNILEVENFILPCIYLIDEVNNIALYQLIECATSHDKVLCEIATKSSLGRLTAQRLIMRTPLGYRVTTSGAEYVRNTFKAQCLDKARIELLNSQNRRNARVKYDRVK